MAREEIEEWLLHLLGERRVLIRGDVSDQKISSLSFEIAQRHALLNTNAFVLILCLQSSSDTLDEEGPVNGPPLKIVRDKECLISKAGAGHGDYEELERIWYKYLDSTLDLPWFLNNVQLWRLHTTQPKPTLLIIDGLINLVADDPTWSFLVLKLVDDAAYFLDAHAIVVAPGEYTQDNLVWSEHYFPTCLTLQSNKCASTINLYIESSSFFPAQLQDDDKECRRKYIGYLEDRGNFLFYRSPSSEATQQGETNLVR